MDKICFMLMYQTCLYWIIWVFLRLAYLHTCYLLTYLLNYLLTYLITDSLTHSLTQWSRVLLEKLTGSQLVKKIFRISCNPEIHHRIYNSPPPVHILSRINLGHALTTHFLKIFLNIILPSRPGSSKWSLSLRFPHRNPIYTSTLPHRF